MGHPEPQGGFAVQTEPSKATKTLQDRQFLSRKSQLRASTSCRPQAHSEAAFPLRPDWLQHPRLSAAPTRPGQRVSLSSHWAFPPASKGMGHTGSCAVFCRDCIPPAEPSTAGAMGIAQGQDKHTLMLPSYTLPAPSYLQRTSP